MCGIFGVISLDKKFSSTDYNKFIESTNLVSYRGPDAEGFWSYNTFNKEVSKENFNLFFGHRRLSIIDLSAEGNQPMEIDDCVIIYNGEIFNYIELKNEYFKEEKFFTQSDTEVIIKIYKKFGTLGFDKLNGMWAFLLYDKKNNKLIISRDRFSIKPLYFYQKGNTYYFASEIKQLLGHVDSVELNRKIFFYFLRQSLFDFNEETFLKGIEKIKPRTNISINLNSNTFTEEEYWQFRKENIGENDFVDKFNQLFENSVKIRLRSDVTVGSLLSGGIDSSAITLISEKHLRGGIKSYSIITDDRQNSEEPFINELVNSYGLKNEKILFDTEIIKSSLDEVIKTQGEPFLSFNVVAQYKLLNKIKENTNIKVILSGQGGDEILAGYLRHFYLYINNMLRSKKFVNAVKELGYSFLYGTALHQFNLSKFLRYQPNLEQSKYKYLKYRLNQLIDIKSFENLNEYQKLDIEKYSIPQLTRYEDRNSMAFSLETRHPFLDHELVNFCLNLESNWKIKDGYQKYILRKSQNQLPEKIRWRKDKKGFTIPEEKWLKKEFYEEIKFLFSKSKLDEMDIIDAEEFLKNYESFVNGNPKIHFFDITKVFIAEKWVRQLYGN